MNRVSRVFVATAAVLVGAQLAFGLSAPAHAISTGSISGHVNIAGAVNVYPGQVNTVNLYRLVSAGDVQPEYVSANLDASGNYSLAGISPGTYTLGFRFGYDSGMGYTTARQQFRGGGASPLGGVMFTLAEGEQLVLSDEQVSPSGKMSGRMTDPAGNPLTGYAVIYQEASRDSDSTLVTSVPIAPDGTWLQNELVANRYVVAFTTYPYLGGTYSYRGWNGVAAPSSPYETQWWGGATTIRTATAVELISQGQSISGISAKLQLPGAPRQPRWSGEHVGGSNPAEDPSSCACGQADPVNTSNGEFYETETDLEVSGVGPGVVVGRNYSSTLSAVATPFGYGWNASFSARVAATTQAVGPYGHPLAVDVIQENGSIVKFDLDTSNSYMPSTRVTARLDYDGDSWTFTRNRNEILRFGADGQLSSLSDRRGNTVSLERDEAGVLTSLTGSGERRIDVSWTGTRVASLTDQANRQLQFGYDIAGDLRSVTGVDGAVTQYEYDNAHHLTKMVKPGGATTTNAYDADFRVVSQSDPIGRVTTFAYTPPTTTIQHSGGSRTVDEYWEGLLIAQTVAAGTPEAATTRQYFNNENRVIRRSDPLGRVTEYEYDANGNQTLVKDPRGGRLTRSFNSYNELTTQTDQMGRSASWSYDANGGVIQATSPSQRQQSWTRNSDGTVASWTDARGNITTYDYDDAGRESAVTNAKFQMQTTGYDPAGRITSTTNALGQTTSHTLDAVGRILTTTDPLNRATSYTYDQRGNLLTTKDAKQQVTSTTYNLADEAIETTDPAGKKTTLTYTARGQIASTTNALNQTSSYGYNLREDHIRTTDPLGRTTLTSFDVAGQSLSTTLPSGAIVSRTYDLKGNIATQTDPNNKKTTWNWNADNTISNVTDPLNRSTSTSYTPDGEVAQIGYPNGRTDIYTYDAAGNRTSLVNPDGEQSAYSFDTTNLLTTRVEPGGLTTRYEYDAAGQVIKETLPDASTITYTYDGAGQRTRSQFSKPGSTDTVTTYDQIGLRTSMVDASGTSTYSYDTRSNLISYTAAGKSLAYAYDDANRLSTLTYPGAKAVKYTWDAAGQMASMTDWSNRVTSFGWTADSRLTTQTFPNTVTETWTYDPAGQTKAIKTAIPTKTHGTYSYSYDAAGQIASDISADAINASLTRVFTYDPIEQLTSSKSGTAAKLTYTATPGKNLTKLADGTLFTYNTAQQVITQKPASGASTSFTYDAKGARLSSTVAAVGSTPAATTTYGYNATDALTTVNLPASSTPITYKVDGDNLRQSRTRGTTTTRYLWNVAGELPVLIEAGTTSYLYGPSRVPLAQIDSAGNIDYLHTDLIGSPRMTTNATGAVTSTNAYDPFGKRTHTGTKDTAFGFSGNYTDPDTGLIYMRARDYDPKTGQFTTVDPALIATNDPYAYASNNPLLRVDPTGLWDIMADLIDPVASNMMHGELAGLTNAIVGFGDGASFGLTNAIRDWAGTNCVVNKDGWYFGGNVAGMVGLDIALGAGVAKAASLLGKADDILSIGNTAQRYEQLSTRPAVTNSKLSNIVDRLYSGQENSARVGNGTTADAIRNELLTGLPTHGRFHMTKGQEAVANLNNVLLKGGLNSADHRAATMLRNELLDVIAGN